MRCPKCGGENLQIISNTTTSGKDFSVTKGLCGSILFGPVGLLCGACGKGKQINTTNYWVCQNCGKKFRV